MTSSHPAVELPAIAGFQLLDVIGKGAMGTVYKARQLSMDRLVALKILAPAVARRDPAFVKRFIREARTSAKLNHPHVIQGFAVGKDRQSGLYYFAMEYVDGPTVRDLLKENRVIEESRALRIVQAIAQALACAHEAGIVHRDIKPDNIILTSQGEAKLADLGLAKRVAEAEAPIAEIEGSAAEPPSSAMLTRVGLALGTPNYMSPEQVRGEYDRVDIRSDLYALGATLFHMLTGRPPFQGEDARAIMAARFHEPAPDARKVNPAVRQEVSRLIGALMQRNPAERMKTPELLLQELDRLLKAREAKPSAKLLDALAKSSRPHRTLFRRIDYRPPVGAGVGWAACLVAVLLAGGVLAIMGGELGWWDWRPLEAFLPRDERAAGPEAPALKAEGPALTPKPNGVPAGPPEAGVTAPELGKAPRSAPEDGAPSAAPLAPPETPAPEAGLSSTQARQRLDGLRREIDADLAAWRHREALAKVVAAETEEALRPFATELAAQRRGIALFAELEACVARGAETLAGGLPFTLEMKDGRKEEVGGQAMQKVAGVRDGILELESNSKHMAFKRSVSLSSLAETTWRELSLRTVRGDPKAIATLRLKWAYADLVRLEAEPDAHKLSEIEKTLAEARAAGASREVLAVVRACFDRLSGRPADPKAGRKTPPKPRQAGDSGTPQRSPAWPGTDSAWRDPRHPVWVLE